MLVLILKIISINIILTTYPVNFPEDVNSPTFFLVLSLTDSAKPACHATTLKV